jgi:hypothetical protein
MKKSIPIAALMGVTGVVGLASVAGAAPVTATLISVSSYSANGSAAWNGTLDTSTWTFDADNAAAAAVQTGGTYSRLSKAGATPLMRHTMTGVTLGSGAAVGTSWACLEGNFGSAVGASICGNYNFGTNLTNQSTYTPTTTGSTVTQGGDDGIIGPSQSLVNSYSGMTLTSLGGGNYLLSNGNAGTSSTTGYDFVFSTGAVVPVPAAVWLFGSALGLMGAMRRRKSA